MTTLATLTDSKGIIICVARNNLALTKRAISSAQAQDFPTDIFLVDNASTDGTAEWAKTKPICRISYLEQRSLGECWNLALKAAWKLHYTHALVINNDVELPKNMYSGLLNYGGSFVTGITAEVIEHLTSIVPLSESPHPDFSCFLIRKSVTDKIGFFDELYFPAYCEDNDYHVRMHRAGIKAVAIDLPFYHERSSTIRNASRKEHIAIGRGAEWNRERFRIKYGCRPGTPEYAKLFSAEVFGSQLVR